MDGWKYYWYDLMKEEQYFSKRTSGEGPVMVWKAISTQEKSQILF